jgi:hypothetical protein
MNAPACTSRWPVRAVLLGTALLLLLLAGPELGVSAQASPSRFVYELCDPQLAGTQSAAFTIVQDSSAALGGGENCGSPNGAVDIWQYGDIGPTFAYRALSIPETPGGFVESETITGEASGLGPTDGGYFIFESGWPTNGPAQARTFFIRNERSPSVNNGNFNIVVNCPSSCPAGPWLKARNIAALEVDPHPPTLTGPSGSLLAPGIVRGHQQLAAEAKDEGGGVSKLEMLVNGVPAGSPLIAACKVGQANNLSYKGSAALTPSPCPPTLKNAWSLDTAVPPFKNGPNTMQVCASDFATVGEPSKTCSQPQAISIDDSCADSPIPGGEQIEANFVGSAKPSLTVSYGHSVRLRGSLTNSTDEGIAGATVCLESRIRGSHQPLALTTVATTDRQGHFIFDLPPAPNRDVLVGYRHDTFQVAKRLTLETRARPSLETDRPSLTNGERLKLRGILPQPKAKGRVVVLQANVLGSRRWITFRKATSGHKGVFKASYRFTSTTRATSYRFRAVVPTQAGYPWAQGHSKPVRVRVAP